jgi:hypothetical protein
MIACVSGSSATGPPETSPSAWSIEQTCAAIDLGLRPFEGLPAIRGEILHPTCWKPPAAIWSRIYYSSRGERQVWIYF